mgnify:CR=1 FL=1
MARYRLLINRYILEMFALLMPIDEQDLTYQKVHEKVYLSFELY